MASIIRAFVDREKYLRPVICRYCRAGNIPCCVAEANAVAVESEASVTISFVSFGKDTVEVKKESNSSQPTSDKLVRRNARSVVAIASDSMRVKRDTSVGCMLSSVRGSLKTRS